MHAKKWKEMVLKVKSCRQWNHPDSIISQASSDMKGQRVQSDRSIPVVTHFFFATLGIGDDNLRIALTSGKSVNFEISWPALAVASLLKT